MEINFNDIIVKGRHRKDYGDLQELKTSIKNIGLLHPVVVNEENILIAGERRLKALRELGYNKIPVNKINLKEVIKGEYDENSIRKDFTYSEKVAIYNAMESYEHKGGLVSETDTKGLKRRQRASKILGISTDSLSKANQIIQSGNKELIEQMDKEKNVNRAYQVLKKEKHKEEIKEAIKGVEDKQFNIYCGDCLTELDKVKNKSVACLIIDAPYGIKYQSNNRLMKHKEIENDDKKAFELLEKSLEKVKPKMLENSHLYFFTSWKVYEKVKPIIEKFFNIKNCLIWDKMSGGMGDLEGNYAEAYEMIIFATQGKRLILSEKRPINVLKCEKTTSLFHPTEKPIKLLKELIENSTLKNELVLDYFAGSGSTLVACKKTNRQFIGIELDKEYCEIIKKRLLEA